MNIKSEHIKKALKWIERETHSRSVHARMLSNGPQGEFLQAFSLMVRPDAILEIGTFTGYSSVCLCRGLRNGGHLDACEMNDEFSDVITEGWRKAGLASHTHLHIGDAHETLERLGGPYDIVYIDADKKSYPDYYELTFDKVRKGGWILIDNVLWNGRIEDGRNAGDPKSSAIADVLSVIAADSRVEAITIPVRDGLCIIQRIC